MSGQHTPGPWFWALDKINQRTNLMRSGSGDYVASPQADMGDYGLSVDCWTDISHADAALIEAAPNMLEALKAVREFVESEVENRGAAGSDHSDYQNEAQEALDIIDAAIAKATWEAL